MGVSVEGCSQIPLGAQLATLRPLAANDEQLMSCVQGYEANHERTSAALHSCYAQCTAHPHSSHASCEQMSASVPSVRSDTNESAPETAGCLAASCRTKRKQSLQETTSPELQKEVAETRAKLERETLEWPDQKTRAYPTFSRESTEPLLGG